MNLQILSSFIISSYQIFERHNKIFAEKQKKMHFLFLAFFT